MGPRESLAIRQCQILRAAQCPPLPKSRKTHEMRPADRDATLATTKLPKIAARSPSYAWASDTRELEQAQLHRLCLLQLTWMTEVASLRRDANPMHRPVDRQATSPDFCKFPENQTAALTGRPAEPHS
jgi:hypothetical protein